MQEPKYHVPLFREQGRAGACRCWQGRQPSSRTPRWRWGANLCRGAALAERGHRSNLPVHEGQGLCASMIPASSAFARVRFVPLGKPSPAESLRSPAQEAFSPARLLPDKAPLRFRRCWAQDGPHSICTFACACVSLVMLLFTLHAKTGLALASQEQM